ncbi:MAG: mandelate racemase [Planctomycetes bacterium]|nr:mandelate racemase [Planctomycetota bacterium]
MTTIQRVTTHDLRFPLPEGSGTDAVHGDPEYSYAVTCLHADGHVGQGAAFTLGDGNDVVAALAQRLGERLLARGGTDLESLTARFGTVQQQLADDSQLRWLGPHKGAVHLALASVTNAVFDLWARVRGVPLWQLLLDLDDDAVVALLDLTWVEDALHRDAARELLAKERPGRGARSGIVDAGYPGYDTSVGWFGYPDELVAENARRAAAAGFRAMKLKVGSADLERDLRRVRIVREAAGDHVLVMVDANQQWCWPRAERACAALAALGVHWIEEPTHPDDVLGHQRLARLIRPAGVKMAVGEHISHRVLFKNFVQARAVDVVQVDALRVAGVSEFLVVSMLARQAGLEVVPHVGDMGQLHQHLVLFNHIALGLPATFLEHIPHLREHFVDPARMEDGVYRTPRVPGAGLALRDTRT